MKDIKDVCFIVQARLNSERVPRKMLKSFANSTLLDICLSKLLRSSVVPKDNIFLSCYEPEIKACGIRHGINIFPRSKQSANEETKMGVIYEWHNKLNIMFKKDYKYAVLISACNPLLSISTIDNFVKEFLSSPKKGAFGVFLNRNYFWSENGKPITDWKKLPIMNTKIVDPVYEAAHCLYATPIGIIKDGFFMDNKSPADPYLFCMEELESFDIDYPWQFDVAEILYEKFKKNTLKPSNVSISKPLKPKCYSNPASKPEPTPEPKPKASPDPKKKTKVKPKPKTIPRVKKIPNTKVILLGPVLDNHISKNFLERKRKEGFSILSFSSSSLVFLHDIGFCPDFHTFIDPQSYCHVIEQIGSDFFKKITFIGQDFTTHKSVLETNATLFNKEGAGISNFLSNSNYLNIYKKNSPIKTYKQCFAFNPFLIDVLTETDFSDIDFESNLYRLLYGRFEIEKFSYYLLPLILFWFNDLSHLDIIGFGHFDKDRYFGGNRNSYDAYQNAYEPALQFYSKINFNKKITISIDKSSLLYSLAQLINNSKI